jgi:hypothetical protein
MALAMEWPSAVDGVTVGFRASPSRALIFRFRPLLAELLYGFSR